MIINLKIANNVKDVSVQTDDSAKLAEVLESNGFNYNGQIMLNGACLAPNDIYKTFSEFGISGNCYITMIQKADNAK